MTVSATPRQQDALRFITGYLELKGYAPSHGEMEEGLGLCRSSTHRLTEGLQERGHLVKLYGKARAIGIVEPVAIPRAPDGTPLYFVRIGEAA